MVKVWKEPLFWALQDQSASWFLDTKTGEVRSDMEGFGEDGEDLEPEDDGRWAEVDRLLPTDSFGFMEDFVSELAAGAARKALSSALGGKGSFRRLRDALPRFPDVRAAVPARRNGS